MNFTKQSAKNEAEKVVMYIQSLMKKSDRIHTSFDIVMEENEIRPSWGKHGENRKKSEYLEPSAGCSYTPSAEKMTYDRNNFTNKSQVIVDEIDNKDKDGKVYDYYIEITDSSGTKCYVGISKNQ